MKGAMALRNSQYAGRERDISELTHPSIAMRMAAQVAFCYGQSMARKSHVDQDRSLLRCIFVTEICKAAYMTKT